MTTSCGVVLDANHWPPRRMGWCAHTHTRASTHTRPHYVCLSVCLRASVNAYLILYISICLCMSISLSLPYAHAHEYATHIYHIYIVLIILYSIYIYNHIICRSYDDHMIYRLWCYPNLGLAPSWPCHQESARTGSWYESQQLVPAAVRSHSLW